MKKLLLVIITSFILFGCATTQSLDVSKRTKIFINPYEDVFKAALEYCNERGFPITNADKDIGYIVTGFRESDATAAFFFGNKRANINFNLSELAPDRTKVILNISFQSQGSFGSWKQQNVLESVAEDAYKDVFKGLSEIL